MRFMLPVMLLMTIGCHASSETTSVLQAPEHDVSFAQTVQTHITAIQSRDLDSLLSTVTEGESLTLVFPGGTTLYTRAEFVDFHISWFADETWSMTIEVLSEQVRGNHGVALVRTTYTDQAGPRQALLALHFALENGKWRLFFDQNTRIADAQ